MTWILRFFFNDTATTEIYTLSLHDALPISMALVTAATERNHHIMAFSSQFVPLAISPRQRLDDALQAVSGLPFTSTDWESTRLKSRHAKISYSVFCLKKKKKPTPPFSFHIL